MKVIDNKRVQIFDKLAASGADTEKKITALDAADMVDICLKQGMQIVEMKQIIENDCLPYSEIHHGFAITMVFYWGEAEQNREEADKWIAEARIVAEKLFPQGLDYIDNMIVPPAIVYIDMQDFTACEAELREGIRICDEYKELSAYRRKKHDLQRYLLDVYLEGKLHVEAREILKILDRECREYGFSDTVQPEVRDYLADRETESNE